MLSNLDINDCAIFHRGENITNLVNATHSLSQAVFSVLLTLFKLRNMNFNEEQ